MLRKERVWRTLSELCHRKISDEQLSNQHRVGFTTLELADALALDRANTSRDLNQLVEEGRVVKLSGKPVLYLDRIFVETKLGIPLKQSCYSNLVALQTGHLQLRTVNSTAKANFDNFPAHTPHNLAPKSRAVRWLDMPDEANAAPDLTDLLAFEQPTPLDLDFSAHFSISELRPPKNYQLGVVVIAHGHTTASSMTEAACALASHDGEYAGGLALDVELEADYNWVLAQTEELVKQSAAANPDGVLLLVDLPRLAGLDGEIEQRTGLKLHSVENVNTAMLVEALRCTKRGQYSLEELSRHLNNHGFSFE